MGDTMFRIKALKKLRKGFVSLLLVLSLMTGVLAPLPAFADAAVAENDEIYAILYYIDPNYRTGDNLYINSKTNIELVFQKGSDLDSSKTLVTDKKGNEAIFSIAADATEYNSNGRPSTPWHAFDSTSQNQNIARVDFKDRIKPAKMDGWFRNASNLTYENILHKENLDTSECTSMLYTFSDCKSFTSFSFSQWPNFDTSNVTTVERMFYNCLSLTDLDMSELDFNRCTNYNHMFLSTKSTIPIRRIRIIAPPSSKQ